MAVSRLRALVRVALIPAGVAAFLFLVITEVKPFDAQRTYEVWNPRGTSGFVITVPFGLSYQAIAGSAGDSRINVVVLRSRVSDLNAVLEKLDCQHFPASTDHRTHIELWAGKNAAYLTRYEMALSDSDLVPDAPHWKPAEERLGHSSKYVAVLERDKHGTPVKYATCLYGTAPRSTSVGACRVVFPTVPSVYAQALLGKVDRAKWPEQVAAIACLARKTAYEISL